LGDFFLCAAFWQIWDIPSPKFWATQFHISGFIPINFDKYGFGYLLGHFFTINASGHPGRN
jgi:hypothetical protein